jgi:hypothetical protein
MSGTYHAHKRVVLYSDYLWGAMLILLAAPSFESSFLTEEPPPLSS